ncbi:hypothetical protein [Mycobacterium sp.]|uniref:hypothetical protein n=1 Tax=Mycobacterium sp. TaxID=1785 RepID=UPI0025E63021|nr:hypothetical protein [Mycobacterium sp.]MBW0014172.1 hypothetical protein [Mycobacterium sp.]
MTDSLVVDPARLKAAGIALRDQVLPESPPQISATGSDPVSAAINQTMPIIESPVVEGLPDAQGALANTGSKIVAAADLYAETDQLLGEHVGTVQFLAASDQRATGAGGETSDKQSAATADKNDAAAAEKADTTPAAGVASNLNQVSAMTQAAQPATQGMQSVMSSVQQMTGGVGNAGASPAKPADDNKADDSAEPDESQTGDAHLVDATSADSGGAAAGGQRSGSAPAQSPTTAGGPETNPLGGT